MSRSASGNVLLREGDGVLGTHRALHGTQDFYAHSNWADEADPTRPIGDDNPPGLNQPGPSAVLDLRSETTPSVPADSRPAASW